MAPSNRSRFANRRQRHVPLAEDVAATGILRTKSKKRKLNAHGGDEEPSYVDSRASSKILRIGRELQDEAEAQDKASQPNPAFAFESRLDINDNGERHDFEEEARYAEEEEWGSDGEDVGDEEDVDPGDLDLFNKFNPSDGQDAITAPAVDEGDSTNLADLILEKIAAHEAHTDSRPVVQGGGPPEDAVELPAKVVEVYTKIGHLLSRYRSGKLPKPLKILPSLPQYPILLSITRPDSWTPNAVFQATRLFISASPDIAQHFCFEVLLPRIRTDIHETRKLNVHLYHSLRKALYKPAPFFKGVLFPLIGSGTCTMREAHIVSSVLVKNSVPVLHSAAALLRLTELAAELTSARDVEAAGSANVFIKVLVEKGYALPYKVIDGLVFHFLRYKGVNFLGSLAEEDGLDQRGSWKNNGNRGGKVKNNGNLPVIWHQCLLVFAQRYRNDITEDQREALLDLLLVRGHKDIGPEVRRELLEGRGRGMPLEEERRWDGDDTMIMA